MDIVTIECPNCGAAVQRNKGEYFGKCPYCGVEVGFDEMKEEVQFVEMQNRINDLNWKITTDKQYKKQLAKWNKGRNRLYFISCLFSTVGFLFAILSTEDDDAFITLGVSLILLALLTLFIGAPLKCIGYPALFEGNEDFASTKISRLGLLVKVTGIGFLLLCGTALCSAIVYAIFSGV